MKAMVLAAGLGTRLKEETRNKPKALVQVGGKPLLQHVIEKLQLLDLEEIVVNVHHFSGLIKDFIKAHDFGIPVSISDETGQLLDTGGGLKKAAPFFPGNEPVLIHNVDVLSSVDLRKLIDSHVHNHALATLVVRNRKTNRYFRFSETKRLVGWRNIKTGETKIAVPEAFDNAMDMAFSGIHIVDSGIFKRMPDERCFSITDFYLKLAESHLIAGYFDDSDWWSDVGKWDDLVEVRRLMEK